MMGDDGEKFGAWPTTWEHCWGERRWVERFFEALEANADWLTTTTPSTWLDGAPADRPRLRPDRLVRRDGRVGAAGRREPGRSRTCSTPRQKRAPAGGALAARRVLAQLPGQVPRDQRPPQADAPDLGQGRRACRPERSGSGRSTTSTRASRTTATGTACSAGSTSATCGSRPTSTSSRPRTWPTGRPASSRPRECRDLDLDGLDEVRLAGPGQVVAIDLTEGAGIGGWDIRAVRHALCAVMRRRPEAYHETLREHEAKGPAGHAASTEGDGAGLDPRDRPDQGAGPRRQALLRPLRAALRAGPLPAARHRAAGLGDRHRRRARRRGRGRLRGRLGRGRPARRGPRRDGDVRGSRGGGPRHQADRDRRRPPVPQPAPRGHASRTDPRSGSTRGSASNGR